MTDLLFHRNFYLSKFFVFLALLVNTTSGQTVEKIVSPLSQLEILSDVDLNQALASIETMKDNASDENSELFFLELEMKRAKVLWQLGAIRTANQIWDTIKNTKLENVSSEIHAHLLLLKSEAFRETENYSQASVLLAKAANIFNKLDNQNGILLYNLHYAELYATLKQYPKALEAISNAIELGGNRLAVDRKIELYTKKAKWEGLAGNKGAYYKNIEIIQASLANEKSELLPARLAMEKANYFMLVQNFDLALEYYSEAENLFKTLNNRRELNEIYLKKAKLFSFRDNAFAQVLYLKQASSQARLLGDIHLVLDAKLKLALAFYNQKKIDSSLIYVNEIVQSSANPNLKIAAYDLGKSIFLAQRKFEKSLNFMELRQKLRDSLENNALNQTIDSSQTEQEFANYEIKIGEAEKEWNSLQLKHQKSTFLLRIVPALLAIIALFGLGLHLFFLHRTNRKRILIEERMFFLQFDAHFVFNALTAIQGFILKNKIFNAEHHLQILADLMQYIAKSANQEKVPLHEEISFLMAYLQIQKLRFGDVLRFEIKIDDALDPEKYSIPPFLSYPFLEFAIENRIQKQESKGSICLEFRKKGKWLFIILSDRNIGFLDQDAFLKRKNLENINLMDLTKSRLRRYNGFLNKKAAMKIENLSAQEQVLHIHLKIE